MDNCTEFLELAQHLNQERLFVDSERKNLQNLNRQVQKTVEYLFHVAWIAKQQRINLDGLILAKPNSTPSACCHRANILENANFVESYKHLGVHESHYGEFIQTLRNNPGLVAMSLAAGQKLDLETMHHTVNVIVNSVYGHCILVEDEQLVLRVLKHLMEMQLATNDNPRRLLRQGSCAFGRVYKVFNEGLFSAKLFLTGALHDPIMTLLMEDELFLDIDPSKAVIRFPLQERLRRFGQEGTAQYANNLQKYRNWTIHKLVNLTNKFIAGLRNNLYCFPSSLLWLVKQLYNMVMKARKVEVREVGAMCADLVFVFFICPAIVNPEPYGICDAPISHIARFNLMQVAQILQVLAMAKWEELDPKLIDLYGKFEKDCMSSLLDFLLEGGVEETPPTSGLQTQGLVRTAALITESDLQCLINFLRHIVNNNAEDWVDKKMLQKLLNILPQSALQSRNTQASILNGISSEPSSPASLSPQSAPLTPQTPASKKTLLGKVGKSRTKGSHSPAIEGNDHGSSLFQQQQQQHHHHHHQRHGEGEEAPTMMPCEMEDVLVISLNVSLECPGMLPEHKILSLDQQTKRSKVRMKVDNMDDEVNPPGEMQEKRTRFSLSHDQDSIGNTSDNLEAVSEAASNHSVTSSLELENENDNLSDMISANVSGRGTPNVSGRDTPSSQVEEEEREHDQRTLDLPVTAQKQNREDISDKFGKFDIKTLIEGDETVSLVSDTWSTDVLASDSETVEQGERQLEDAATLMNRGVRMLDIAHAMGAGSAVGSNTSLGGLGSGPSALDVFDAGSEAWSMDVSASDTERLQDVDTDDTGSIARSDDTASLARSDDATRLEIDTSLTEPRVDVLVKIEGHEHCGDENVTPRASGTHSPIDGPGIGCGPSGTWLSTLHAAAGFKPIQESQTNKLQSPVNDAVQTSQSLQKPQPPTLSDLAQEFDDLKLRREEKPKTGRMVGGFKYIQGKVASIVNAFDPLAEVNLSVDLYSTQDSSTASEENYCPPSDDTSTSEIMGMQSLGRLSLAMEELPDNGILLPDIPLPLNCSVSGLADSNTASKLDVPSDVDPCIDGPMTTAFVLNRSSMDLMDNGESAVPVSDDVDASGTFHSPGFPPSVGLLLQNGATLASANPPFFVHPELSCNGQNKGVDHPDNVLSRLSNASLGSSSSSSNSLSALGEVKNLKVAFHDLSDSGLDNSAIESSLMDSPAPTASSGAIPKSISFDKTAEKGDKETLDGDESKKKSIFKMLKMSLKRPGKKGNRYHEEQRHYDRGNSDAAHDGSASNYQQRKFQSQDRDSRSQVQFLNESGDDILAKYRKKTTSVTSDESIYSCSGPLSNDVDPPLDRINGHTSARDPRSNVLASEDDSPAIDSQNFEESFAFVNAKRKLRLVLSTADAQTSPWLRKSIMGGRMDGLDSKSNNELVAFLKTQLAEAINLQDRSLTAQLHETLRCISIFDKAGCKTLFNSLKEDYTNRYPYIAYLIRCRQGLLSALAHLERLLKRVERDKAVCSQFMISVCVRFFLEHHDRAIHNFLNEFQKLTVSDEKTEFVENFLHFLYEQMELDPIWQGASAIQIELAQNAIERSIMSQICIHALYPNGDGDVHRDQVLHEHILKLSKVINPDHNDLRIPKIYHYECPWPSAQAEIITINAYKTPGDKLQCVVRCCTTIMNLLSMANQKSVPAADDFIPVLVYILIKANPTNLLSTIQYVNNFYQKQLKGEDEYWWTQFCSAVEFIKTMDYTE